MSWRAAAFALLCVLVSSAQAAQPTPATDAVFAHPTAGRALLSTTLAQPARALAQAQVLRGAFAHQRHLSEMPQPLTASGNFVFARELGVYWRTLQPFESELVLSERGVIQRDEGAESLRISAQEQPGVRVLADIFLALFTLDVRSMEASFELYAMSQGERWLVGLKPRSTALAHVFDRATLSGAQHVEQIVLTDARGDRTVIELRDIQIATAPPDAQTRALFAP